jgi:hypothetical protein
MGVLWTLTTRSVSGGRQRSVGKSRLKLATELTRQAGCALPTISRTWLREEKAAVDKRSLCEPTNRKPDQYYGSRAELPGISNKAGVAKFFAA